MSETDSAHRTTRPPTAAAEAKEPSKPMSMLHSAAGNTPINLSTPSSSAAYLTSLVEKPETQSIVFHLLLGEAKPSTGDLSAVEIEPYSFDFESQNLKIGDGISRTPEHNIDPKVLPGNKEGFHADLLNGNVDGEKQKKVGAWLVKHDQGGFGRLDNIDDKESKGKRHLWISGFALLSIMIIAATTLGVLLSRSSDVTTGVTVANSHTECIYGLPYGAFNKSQYTPEIRLKLRLSEVCSIYPDLTGCYAKSNAPPYAADMTLDRGAWFFEDRVTLEYSHLDENYTATNRSLLVARLQIQLAHDTENNNRAFVYNALIDSDIGCVVDLISYEIANVEVPNFSDENSTANVSSTSNQVLEWDSLVFSNITTNFPRDFLFFRPNRYRCGQFAKVNSTRSATEFVKMFLVNPLLALYDNETDVWVVDTPVQNATFTVDPYPNQSPSDYSFLVGINDSRSVFLLDTLHDDNDNSSESLKSLLRFDADEIFYYPYQAFTLFFSRFNDTNATADSIPILPTSFKEYCTADDSDDAALFLRVFSEISSRHDISHFGVGSTLRANPDQSLSLCYEDCYRASAVDSIPTCLSLCATELLNQTEMLNTTRRILQASWGGSIQSEDEELRRNVESHPHAHKMWSEYHRLLGDDDAVSKWEVRAATTIQSEISRSSALGPIQARVNNVTAFLTKYYPEIMTGSASAAELVSKITDLSSALSVREQKLQLLESSLGGLRNVLSKGGLIKTLSKPIVQGLDGCSLILNIVSTLPLIGPVATAIGAFIQPVKEFLAEFIETVDKVANGGIEDFLLTTGDALASMETIRALLIRAYVVLGRDVKPIVQSLVQFSQLESTSSELLPIVNGITKTLSSFDPAMNLLTQATKMLSAIVDNIKPVDAGLDLIIKTVKAFKQLYDSTIRDIISSIERVLRTTIPIRSKILAARASVKRLCLDAATKPCVFTCRQISAVAETVNRAVGATVRELKEVAKQAEATFNNAKQEVAKAREILQDALDEKAKAVEKKWEDSKAAIQKTWTNTLAGPARTWNDAKAVVSNGLQNFFNGLKDIGGDIADAVKNPKEMVDHGVTTVVNVVQDPGGTVKKGLNNLSKGKLPWKRRRLDSCQETCDAISDPVCDGTSLVAVPPYLDMYQDMTVEEILKMASTTLSFVNPLELVKSIILDALGGELLKQLAMDRLEAVALPRLQDELLTASTTVQNILPPDLACIAVTVSGDSPANPLSCPPFKTILDQVDKILSKPFVIPPPPTSSPISSIDPCQDGVRNGDETGIDCGGSICAARCGLGIACSQSSDCATGATCDSVGNRCVTYAPTAKPTTSPAEDPCFNQLLDVDETDVDCGDACALVTKCGVGKGCRKNFDCISGSCSLGKCVTKAPTTLPTQSPTLSPTEKPTQSPTISPTLRPTSHCFSGVKDGDETGKDCGGPNDCFRCPSGQGCLTNDDCDPTVSTLICAESKTCTPHCSSGFQDGDETDLDCGGSFCKKCDLNNGCKENTDCNYPLAVCFQGHCKDPCSNGVRDYGESGTDCGGGTPCKRCEVNQPCTQPTDCLAGLTCNSNGFCVVPTPAPTLTPTQPPHCTCPGSTYYLGSIRLRNAAAYLARQDSGHGIIYQNGDPGHKTIWTACRWGNSRIILMVEANCDVLTGEPDQPYEGSELTTRGYGYNSHQIWETKGTDGVGWPQSASCWMTVKMMTYPGAAVLGYEPKAQTNPPIGSRITASATNTLYWCFEQVHS